MSYTGIVENGKVTLPPEAALADGTKVRVEPMEQPGSLAGAFKEFIGVFKDLPEDLAENHDHYLHGTPRK